ncbi:6610_t:CDS:2 [Ambispora leptoticha]|uniref:6610_t:CDS:1 n=1 Tax=Ambispora leptoticha TaxID=144679 RepID=A0A9N9F310_9GLOM|nr:6610_t:CDS:2 [Ambispora leptoticha]
MSKSKSGFSSPSINLPPGHDTPPPGHRTAPPGHAPPPGHESSISRDPSMSSTGSYDYDVSDYYYPERSSRDPRFQQQNPHNTYSSSASRETLSPTPIPIPKSSTRHSPSSQSRGITQQQQHQNFSASNPKMQNSINQSTSLNSFTYVYPSNNSTPLSDSNNFLNLSSSHPDNSPPSPYIVPDPPLPDNHVNSNSASHMDKHSQQQIPQHLNFNLPSQTSFSQEFSFSSRPFSQESLADPFNNSAVQRQEYSSNNNKSNSNDTSRSIHITSETPNQQHPRQQPLQIPPPQFPPTRQLSQRSVHSVQNLSLSKEYVQKAIKCHEENQLEKSAHYLRIAAEQGSPAAMVLYGIALRHGWGCKKDEASAFRYLQLAAKSALGDPTKIQQSVNMSNVKGEMILAIYELGMCFRHGWGIPKNKSTAAYYFQIAADLGDPDAQNDIALCYYKGEGVKKDMKAAAKYYRMAHAQGQGTMGNSWIFKSKYDSA